MKLALKDSTDKEFYSNVYARRDYCMSMTVVAEKAIPDGWIMSLIGTTNLYNYGIHGLPQHITKVPFCLGSSPDEYAWHSGVFSSKLDEEN